MYDGDVVIARAFLDVQGVRNGADDPREFAKRVFEGVEGGLEGDWSRETFEIPRIDLDIQLTDGWDLAAAIGRAIAREIQARIPRDTVGWTPLDVRQVLLRVPTSLRALIEAALVTERTGEAASSNTAIARAASWISDGAEGFSVSMDESDETVAILGALARAGQLLSWVASLSDAHAIRLLERIERSVRRFPIGLSRRPVSGMASRGERFAATALTGGPPSGGRHVPASMRTTADAARSLAIAIGHVARISSDLVLRSPTTLAAILTFAEDARRAESAGSLPSDQVRTQATVLPSSDGSSETNGAATAIDQSAPTEAGVDTLVSDTGAEQARRSAAAGLSFLVGPLCDLGFDTALASVSTEPSIVLHEVLRRILEISGIEVPEGDPATWMLAGLLAAPDDDDRAEDVATWTPAERIAFARAAGAEATDHGGMVDAWARATLEEARARLEGTEAAESLGRQVIAIPGALELEDERLTVSMPFTDAYEPLLRAGLPADLPSVPWLDGRALRFLFVEVP